MFPTRVFMVHPRIVYLWYIAGLVNSWTQQGLSGDQAEHLKKKMQQSKWSYFSNVNQSGFSHVLQFIQSDTFTFS